ncbi:MAG: hypothetical protein AAFO91_15720 [Bacteroidota bacterium]
MRFLLTFFVSAALISTPLSGHAQAPDEPLSAEQQTRIINLAANISNKMEATVERLTQISSRMLARNNLLDIEPEVRSEVDRTIGRVDPLLNEARGILGSMDTRVREAVTAENPREAWRSVRALYLSSKQNLRDVKGLLVSSHTLMKDPSSFTPNAPTDTATTSTETANQSDT